MKNVIEVVGVYYCFTCGGALQASYLMKVVPASHDDPGEVSVGEYRYRHTVDDSGSSNHTKTESINCAECRDVAESLEGCEDMEIAGFEEIEEHQFNGVDRAVG